MIYEVGEFLGGVIIAFYVLTILNFFVKFINKRYRKIIKKNDTIFSIFSFVMKIVVRYHRLFGFLTIAALLSHFLIQFNYYGVSITGAMAAGILLLQVGVGIYGYKTKKRGGPWLFIHRGIAVLLLVAILIHIN